MIPSHDWYVLLECVHSKNWINHLLCEFPECCHGCIYEDVHGTHNVKKALALYHAYQKQLKDDYERDMSLGI